MSRVTVTESYLQAIADAIRGKNGSSDTYTPAQMAAAITAIPTGGTPTGTINITENGTVDVAQYASANVNVLPTLQSKTVTENGTYTPDSGYDGLSSVTVNVSGGGGSNRVHIIDPAFLLAAYNNNGGRRTIEYRQFMPASWMACFQNDYVYYYLNGNDPYIRVTRGNNKVIQFGTRIPAGCQTLYLDIAADAGSENYPISTLNIVDALGITGFYSGNWSGTTLKSYTLTNDTDPGEQAGLTLTRTSARVVPRQVAQIDMSGVAVDSWFTYFGCRSYFDIYGIWAE